MKAAIHINVQIPQEVHDQIQEIAKIEDRTLSKVINRLLKRALEKYEANPS